jgi:hypothetical protein
MMHLLLFPHVHALNVFMHKGLVDSEIVVSSCPSLKMLSLGVIKFWTLCSLQMSVWTIV